MSHGGRPQAGRDQARPYRLARSGADQSRPRPSDLSIQTLAEARGGIYRPSEHLDLTREIIDQPYDPDAIIRSHVRRLEALRLAGYVKRMDADH